MVVPTESFTEIADADIDPDSPITTGLMTSYRDNDLNLNSQLIGETAPFTAAQKHNHDGVNSAAISGSMVLVEHKEISGGAVSNVVFSTGIDGDTDFYYEIRYQVKHVLDAGQRQDRILLLPNSLGMTEGWQQRIDDVAASTLSNTPGAVMSLCDGTNSCGGVIRMETARTVQAVTMELAAHFVGYSTFSTVSYHWHGSTNVAGLAANLTSIRLESRDNANALRANWNNGSYFTLYKIPKV